MGIVRGRFEFEGRFTQVPNDWARDKGLSLKARGLLVELMSHQAGWNITLESLRSEKDGTGAVRSAVTELEEAGWLTVERQRDENGRLGAADYFLKEPARSEPECNFPTLADPTLANPGTKNTIPLEDYLKNYPSPDEEQFDEWWKVYPRKAAKGDARSAFKSAIKNKKISFEDLMVASRLYADERSKVPAGDKKFTPYPASWLNKEMWEDVGSSGLNAEIEDLVAAEDVMGLQTLTGVRCPFPDFGDVSPAESSQLSIGFWRSWVSEQKESLIAAAAEKAAAG